MVAIVASLRDAVKGWYVNPTLRLTACVGLLKFSIFDAVEGPVTWVHTAPKGLCGVSTRRCLVSAKETSFLCARLCNVIKIQHLRCCWEIVNTTDCGQNSRHCRVSPRRCKGQYRGPHTAPKGLCGVIKIQHLRCCWGASNLGPYCAERLVWGFYETLLGLGKGNKLPLRSTYILACRRHALSKTKLIGPTPYFFLTSFFITIFVPRLGVDGSNSHSS